MAQEPHCYNLRRHLSVDGNFAYPVPGGTFTVSLPYSTYNKVGTIDHGDIVDNKRLSQVLRTAQIVQSQRDDRIVCRPSTAHRVDGTPIARNKIAGAKRQRDLSEDDLHDAIKSTLPWPKAGKRSNVLTSPKADISN
jgi:hypothetical protein